MMAQGKPANPQILGATPKRYFAQHLDPSRVPNGENWTGYFDSLEDAHAASEVALAAYSDTAVRATIQQEVTDTVAPGRTWVRRGDGPWSLIPPS